MEEPTQRQRKAHKKSRGGCSNCKQKRIKCDELRPSCSNCTRRFDHCSFQEFAGSPAKSPNEQLNTPSSNSSVALQHQSNRASPAVRDQFGLRPALNEVQFADFELLHNFIMKTGPSLAPDGVPAELEYWQTILPQFGFAHSHVMHLILAVSAFHLYQQHPERTELVARAESFYGRALPAVIEILPDMSSANAEELHICSTMICFYNFSRGPQPGQYIAFSDSGSAEWLSLIRGVRVIFEKHRDVLFSGILAPVINAHMYSRRYMRMPLPQKALEPGGQSDGLSQFLKALEAETAWFEAYIEPNMRDQPRPRLQEAKAPLDDLNVWLKSLMTDDSSFDKYCAPLDDLIRSLDGYCKLKHGETEFPIVFGWLYRVSDEYVDALQAKKPLALIIFAFYTVLLKETEENRWLLKGWSAHVLAGVLKYLHPDYHKWIVKPKDLIA